MIEPTVDNIEEVKNALSRKLDIKDKDLGELGSFIGVKFIRDESGAWLLQCHYIDDVINAFGINRCKVLSTPTTQLVKHTDETELVDQTYYHKMVGALLFLASKTRSDISLAVNLLTRNCSSPTKPDSILAKRVLGYLSNTRYIGIGLAREEKQLIGYCNGDWGVDVTDRRPFFGMLLKIGATPVFWRSRKQNWIALSTSEVEFISLSEACQHNL